LSQALDFGGCRAEAAIDYDGFSSGDVEGEMPGGFGSLTFLGNGIAMLVDNVLVEAILDERVWLSVPKRL
jgi:hypothetical protein